MPVDPGRMMVRARMTEHLEGLKSRFPKELADCEIVTTEYTDYACRLFVDKAKWVRVAATIAEETDYDNFKNAAKSHLGRSGGEYEHALHEVWSVMYRLQR